MKTDIKSIAAVYPKLYRAISSYNRDELPPIIPTKSGFPTLLAQESKIYLHSRYNPQKEAKETIKKVLDKTTNNNHWALVVFGCGLGYIPELLKDSGIRHQAIVEPDLGVFIRALEIHDFTEILLNRHHLVLVGTDLEEARVLLQGWKLRNAILDELFFIKNPPWLQLYPLYLAQIYNFISDGAEMTPLRENLYLDMAQKGIPKADLEPGWPDLNDHQKAKNEMITYLTYMRLKGR